MYIDTNVQRKNSCFKVVLKVVQKIVLFVNTYSTPHPFFTCLQSEGCCGEAKRWLEDSCYFLLKADWEYKWFIYVYCWPKASNLDVFSEYTQNSQ